MFNKYYDSNFILSLIVIFCLPILNMDHSIKISNTDAQAIFAILYADIILLP